VHGAPFKDFKLPENDFQRLNPMINSSFISEPEQHTQNVHPNSEPEPEVGTTFMSLQPKVKNQVVYRMASLDHVPCKGTQNKDWAWYEGSCAGKTWKDAGKLPKCSPSGGGVAFVCSGGGRDTGGKMLEKLLGDREYVFPGPDGCPESITGTSWTTKLEEALEENNTVKLCPNSGNLTGYCDAVSQAIPSGDRTGTGGKCVGWYSGWGADDCSSGRKKFVEMFYDEASETQKPFCPIVTAVMDHESGFAANARSWDGCIGGKGALGLFQFDSGSNMVTIPVSPAAQFKQFFEITSDYPNLNNMATRWNSCNTAGAIGATGVKEDDYKKAYCACKKANSTVTLSTTPSKLPNNQTCTAAKDFALSITCDLNV